ncbi:protein of unknown function [Citrobacter amalonaticus]|uniref:Uncharacterized protein n=1 Tax=Citrobacter amalonaticus TaxID=35703 RepID=A0AAX2BHW0_CITAM|nr:hypothetical protein TUM16655_21980 [Enterobacter cloacae]GJK85192.1 hypothetical protein TUM17567_14870 [Citrobacter amalonaticus]SAZ40962.1 protein of unknown function [Citrobacter amalonaticus]SBA06669.1 protein of unknown function [Citrobacter amalonaticus]
MHNCTRSGCEGDMYDMASVMSGLNLKMPSDTFNSIRGEEMGGNHDGVLSATESVLYTG